MVGGHAFEHFGQRRAAGECGRAAIGEKARGFDTTIDDAQREAQAVAADRIRQLRDGVGVREFARVARMREMILERGGIGQGAKLKVQS